MGKLGAALAGALALVAAGAHALPLPADELERECWQRYTRERTRVNLNEPTAVAFANLVRGQTLRSPFVVDFAVRGMGVVPAGQALKGTGHHHILIDTPLPIDIAAKIPFSDTHRHFGKGQTGAVLDLPAGHHTLRLLFADHEHRPYFVYSPEVEINVLGPRTPRVLPIDRLQFDASCAAWYQDELTRPRPPGDLVYVQNLRDGEAVSSPFNLRFGVDGWGVCAAGPTVERTGHFAFELRQGGQLVRTQSFANGATQTTLSLPNGSYGLTLRFIDARTQRDLLPPSQTTLVVGAQERL